MPSRLLSSTKTALQTTAYNEKKTDFYQEIHLTSLFKSKRWHAPSYWNYVRQVRPVRNMIYHYNHNCYNESQPPAVDEVLNIIFSNNFMIVPFFLAVWFFKVL